MSEALPDVPGLEPSDLAGASFDRSRKGFEPTEVRSVLGRGADALRVWADRDAQLVRRVEDLSRRLDEAEEFDEARVTELLGAETARIVSAARSAAADMREHAQRESTELLDAARTEAEATAESLVQEAAQDREAAETARSESESAAAEARAAASAEAERLTTDASEAAEQVRTAAESEAEQLTTASRERHDELIASATAVLEERTEEAESAAAEIKAAAEAELEEARSSAAERLTNAALEAERLIADARAAAVVETDRARDEGREMVAEAREVRQRMLRDLAERSRTGRQKVEAAKAARAGVMEAIRSASGRMEETLLGLEDADHGIARIADAAAASVADDVDTGVRELEEHLEAGRQGSDGPAAQLDAQTDLSAEDPGEPEPASGESGGGDSAVEAVGADEVEEGHGDDAADSGDDGTTAGVEPTDEQVDAADSGPGEGSVEGSGDDRATLAADPAGGKHMASVHDLFQKLRSTDVGTPDGDTSDGVTATGAEADADGDMADQAEGASVTDIAAEVDVSANDSIDLTGDESAASTTAPGTAPTEATPGDNGSDNVSTEATAAADSAGALALATEDSRSPDAVLLDRRDELLEPAERLLARNLKRLVSDEQNEVLDRARRIKRQRAELDDLLEGDAAEAYVAALVEPYLLAAAAGAQLWCEGSGSSMVQPERADVIEALERQVDELLELRRVHVREALESHDRSGSDTHELVDQMRAAYRELRTSAVPELAADLAAGGFTAGSMRAAGAGDSWRWVPDNGGLPCADAEDNALAGSLACGTEFPTGDVVPPAHPGCRCIVVPIEP